MWKPAVGRRGPVMFSFGNHRAYIWENYSLLFKGTYKVSNTLNPRAEVALFKSTWVIIEGD